MKTTTDIKKKVRTFIGACKVLKLDPNKVIPDYKHYPKEDRAAMIAHAKLVIICKALNEGWKPNWNDSSQYKYFPWFNMQNGFSYYLYGDYGSITHVSSRLTYKSAELAEYAGKQFLKLYKDYYTISKK